MGWGDLEIELRYYGRRWKGRSVIPAFIDSGRRRGNRWGGIIITGDWIGQNRIVWGGIVIIGYWFDHGSFVL